MAKQKKKKKSNLIYIICALTLIVIAAIVCINYLLDETFSLLDHAEKSHSEGWIRCVRQGYLVPEGYDCLDSCCYGGCINRDKYGNQVNLTCGPCGDGIYYSPLEICNRMRYKK